MLDIFVDKLQKPMAKFRKLVDGLYNNLACSQNEVVDSRCYIKLTSGEKEQDEAINEILQSVEKQDET